MRRWSIRIALGLVVLLIVAAVVVQVVLWTDIPRKLVVSQLQRQLNLHVSAASMSTGWFGGSTLHDVTLSLPLAEESFLAVPTLEVEHTSIPFLLIGRPITIEAIELAKPSLVIRQNLAGRWNVQDVLQLVTRLGGAEQASASDGAMALPRLAITDGSVRVIDRRQRETTIAPLQVTGRPQGALAWQYDAAVPNHLELKGQLAPGTLWNHRVEFSVRSIEQWVRPWVTAWPASNGVAGEWTGQIQNDELVGRLTLANLTVADVNAAGSLHVRGAATRTVVRPDNFIVKLPQQQQVLPQARFTTGSVAFEGSQISVEKLRFAAGGGMAEIDGNLAWSGESGAVTAVWEQITAPRGITHGGKLSATLRTPWPNQPQLSMELASKGDAGGVGAWDANLKLWGNGESWRKINWQLYAPRLAFESNKTYVVDDLYATLKSNERTIELTEMHVPTEELIAGAGAYHFDTNHWWFWSDARGWKVPATGETLSFTLDAWGDPEQARLNRIYVKSGDLDASVDGYYIYDRPKPLDVNLRLVHTPPDRGDEEGQFLRGRLRGEYHLTGTVKPMSLELNGRLFGRGLFIKERPLGDLAVVVTGTVDDKQAELDSERIAILGGSWALHAIYPMQRHQTPQLTVQVSDLPLGEVGEVLDVGELSGRLNGRWIFEIPRGDPTQLSGRGTFEAADVTAPQVRAARVEGRTELRDGIVTFDPLVLSEGDGRAEGRLSLNTRDAKNLQVALTLTHWPYAVPQSPARLLLSGDTKLDVNIPQRSAFGTVQVDADVFLREQLLGHARVEAQALNRAIDVRKFDAEVAQGRIYGTASLDLQDPSQSIGELTFSGISGEGLVALFPAAKGLVGTFDGLARLGPAQDPRALEPSRLSVDLIPQNARFNTIDLGKGQFIAFLRIENSSGGVPVLQRFILDRSTIAVADGTVELWMRSSRQNGGRLQSQVIVQFNRLSLDQVVHAVSPEAKEMPGRLAGRMSLVGNVRRPSMLFGEGSVRISESDLIHSETIGLLYSAMNVGGGSNGGPQGTGAMDLRLERSVLNLSNARYFDRGTEVRANVSILDVWKFSDAKLDGWAVGTARPLKNLKLPFMADVDEIFSVLQSNVTTVKIEGTVRDSDPKLRPFNELGESMKRFLLGDVQREGTQ